jgi:hypothetical protein
LGSEGVGSPGNKREAKRPEQQKSSGSHAYEETPIRSKVP